MASISNSGDAFDRNVAPKYVGKKLEDENLAAARALNKTVKNLSGKINSLEISAPATVLNEMARRERVIASNGKTKETARRLLQTLVDREQTRSSENAQTKAHMDALTEAACSLCRELRVGLQEHISSLIKSNAEANKSFSTAQQELSDTKILLKGVQLELQQLKSQGAVDNGSEKRVNEEMSKLSEDIARLLEKRSESNEKKSSEQNAELTNLNTLYLIECSSRKQADIQVQNLHLRLDQLEQVRVDLTKKLEREERRSEGFEKDIRQLEADNRELKSVGSGQLIKISELQNKLLEMESNGKKHEHELTDAISKSKVLEKRIEGLVRESATKTQEISDLKMSIIDKEATISSLNSTIKQRDAELEAQRKDHGTTVESLREDLLEKTSLISSKDATITELNSEIEQLRISSDEKDNTITQLQADRPPEFSAEDLRKAHDNWLLTHQVKNLEAANRTLTEARTGLENQNSTLSERLKRIKDSLSEKSSEYDKAQKQLISLTKDNETNLQEKTKLRSQLDLELDNSRLLTAELQQAEDRITQANEDHKRALESKESTYSKLDDAHTELKASSTHTESELRELREDYKRLSEKLEREAAGREKLKQEAGKLETDISNKNIREAGLQGELKGLRDQLTSLRNENNATIDQLSKSNAQSAELVTANEKLCREIHEANQLKQEAKKAAEVSKNAKRKLKQEMDQLKALNDEKIAQLTRVEAGGKASASKTQELQTLVIRLNSELESVKKDKEDYLSVIRELDDKIEERDMKNEEREKEFTQYKEDAGNTKQWYEKQYANLEDQNEKLRDEIATRTQQVTELVRLKIEADAAKEHAEQSIFFADTTASSWQRESQTMTKKYNKEHQLYVNALEKIEKLKKEAQDATEKKMKALHDLADLSQTTVQTKLYNLLRDAHADCDSTISQLNKQARADKSRLDSELTDCQFELAKLESEHKGCAERLSALDRSRRMDDHPDDRALRSRDVTSQYPVPQGDLRTEDLNNPDTNTTQDLDTTRDVDMDLQDQPSHQASRDSSPGGVPLHTYPYLSRESSVASDFTYKSPYVGRTLGRNDMQRSEPSSSYYGDRSMSGTPAPAWDRGRWSRTPHQDDSEGDIEMEDASPSGQRVAKLTPGLGSSGIGGSARQRSSSLQSHHSLGDESMTESAMGGDSPTRFQFLVSGRPFDGVKTRNVHPQVVQSVERMIEKWNKKKKAGKWVQWAPVYRCVDVRFGGDNTTRCPPHADTSDWSACRQCITRKQPCMMVLKDVEPLVLPLPIGERPANSTPRDINYYIKQNVNS